MADSRSTSRSRGTLSLAPSRRSQRSQRSQRSRLAEMNRVISSGAFDDHHVYAQDDSSEDEYDDIVKDDQPIGGPVDRDANLDSDQDHPREEAVEEVESTHSDEKDEKDEKDLEAQEAAASRVQSIRSRRSNRSIKDPNLVTWDGPDDPDNPKNWPMKRKWAATFVVSSFTFISPVSSSIVAPALTALATDLHITQEVELQMTLSIFVLAYGIGPLFLGPLSEVYGRAHVLQLANLFFLCWNLGCGFAQNKGQLIAFRFLAGLGGSAPLAIGGGVLSDCWSADQRGKAVSIYTMAPLLGPTVGPIAGGFIAQYSTWRWAFWSLTIATVLIQLSGLFFLQETYPPQILKKRAQKLRKETGNQEWHTENEKLDSHLYHALSIALVRPFILLFTQPIIQFIAIYMAYLYGLMYLILSTFPTLWTDTYNESVSIGGLNYISLGVGFGLGTQITAPINDAIYRKLKKRNNGVGRPEFRIPLMFIGSPLVPIGLFWYGWSAQAQVQWIMPNIGAALYAAGTIVCFQCMQTYIVDAYARYAASGVASAVVLRSMAGFGFPLFAPAMYNALGLGWGNSVLGFAALAIGIPAPFMFWFFGEKLRAKSQFAAGGDTK